MQSGMMMRMLFALMDSDGDGSVSLQEFQAAHERIFKAMDANKDGVLTLEEIYKPSCGEPGPLFRGSRSQRCCVLLGDRSGWAWGCSSGRR